MNCHVSHCQSGANPGCPVGGAANPGGRARLYDFSKFSEKLHEIEKILGRWGGMPEVHSLDPPLTAITKNHKKGYIGSSGKLKTKNEKKKSKTQLDQTQPNLNKKYPSPKVKVSLSNFLTLSDPTGLNRMTTKGPTHKTEIFSFFPSSPNQNSLTRPDPTLPDYPTCVQSNPTFRCGS